MNKSYHAGSKKACSQRLQHMVSTTLQVLIARSFLFRAARRLCPFGRPRSCKILDINSVCFQCLQTCIILMGSTYDHNRSYDMLGNFVSGHGESL